MRQPHLTARYPLRNRWFEFLFVVIAMGLPFCRVSSAEEGSSSLQREVIVIVGAPGTEEYGIEFRKWADRWSSACRQQKISYREIDGTKSANAEEPADRDRLQQWIAERVQTPIEELWLVLIGHGTAVRDTAKFNLRGPDITDKELAEALKSYKNTLVVVDATSSSSPFLNRLSGPNRVVITATKSGSEINYARFGDYFSRAIADLEADLDHDQSVSVLEAFLSASGQVEQFYEQESRLATEQALLDDNGDERGTPASFFRGIRPVKAPAEGKELDGRLAGRIRLFSSSDQPVLTDEENARLKALENQIEDLRKKKSQLAEDDYYLQLESLLIELATALRLTQPSNPN